MRSRLLPAVACAASLVLAGSTSATAADAAAAGAGELEVTSSVAGGRPTTSIGLSAWPEISGRIAPTAAVRVAIPRGYTVDLDRPPGAEVGFAVVSLDETSGRGEPVTFLGGGLIAEDPAASLQDAAAQACAPGPHSAVWSVTQMVDSRMHRLLVFVDAVAGDSETGYTLQLCPLWGPSAEFAGGLTSHAMLLILDGVKTPTSPGVYTWSALVTPADPATLAAQPERAFEVRSVRPLPHTLTMSARHEPKTRSVVISGKLTAAGRPTAGASVSVTAYTGTYDFTRYGTVKTRADGSFSLRRAIDRTTVFRAIAYVPPRGCTAPSTAPAGCVGETVSPPTQPTTSLRIPRATDPRRAIRKGDTALARKAGLRRADFPPDWEADAPSPFAVCEDFQPNLSDLTVTGEASSALFYGEEAVVSSRASVFRSATQARSAFGRVARVEVARCLARDLRDADFDVLQVQTVDNPALENDVRVFRVIADQEQLIVYYDVIYVLRGRVVVEMFVGSLKQALLNEAELVSKLTARASVS